MNQPLSTSFDSFGEKLILRTRFSNGDGTASTIVVDLAELAKKTQDRYLTELVNRLKK